MSNVTVYCEARDCKFWDSGCKADFTTIGSGGDCLGYEIKSLLKGE